MNLHELLYEGILPANVKAFILDVTGNVMPAAKVRLDTAFKQKMKSVPKMSKMLVQKIADVIAPKLEQDPTADFSEELPDMIAKFMQYKKYEPLKFEGDISNKDDLLKYAEEQIVAKYAEDIYGAVDSDQEPQTSEPATNQDDPFEEALKQYLSSKGLIRGGLTYKELREFLFANKYKDPERWMELAGLYMKNSGRVVSNEDLKKIHEYINSNAGSLGTQ
ncbi:MAG: hypothetical protein H8D23_31795 [Candidatus Brocadiales bacterium]|nr:hypothetical protein [Candidatus Brocadiales bacterium]